MNDLRDRVANRLPTVAWLPAASLLAVCLSACSSRGPAGADDELARQQRATLDWVLFADNPRPPLPSAAEENAARTAILRAAPWERELLETLYPGDRPLQALALRDTDADGITDFRISDYYGRFLEGDTDLDGDGSDNLLDADPYDPAFGRLPGPAIPAHLSWQRLGKPADMAAAQRRLFEQHGILLVERSAEFPPRLASVTSDVVTRVFAGTFGQSSSLPTLRLIATAETSLLIADDESAGDFAQIFAATRTMEIYRPGIEAEPVVQLGFVAHEIGHSIQYALDFSQPEQTAIVRRNVAAAENFHALVADFGWTRQANDSDPDAEYSLFRPQYIAPEPYRYLYDGEPVEYWQAWLADLYSEVGEDYLLDSGVTERHVLGEYSLSSPWEWYSDHLIAYVYLEMLDSLAAACTPTALGQIGQWLHETVSAAWPGFRFENARGAPFQAYLRQAHPIAADDARYLAATYLPVQSCNL
jgi:hypothetical protein